MKKNSIIIILTLIIFALCFLALMYFYKYDTRAEYINELESRIDNLEYLSSKCGQEIAHAKLQKKYKIVSQDNTNITLVDKSKPSSIGYSLNLIDNKIQSVKVTKAY